MSKFCVLANNKKSYSIALNNGAAIREEFGDTAVLVRCDRTDQEDNDRGWSLANKICDFLNTLSETERTSLLADEMIPVMRTL